MADRKQVSALTKTPVTVQPFSVATLDFIDSKPNYFRVQNSGESNIYCATSRYPTTNDYDFMVKPAGLMSYAEPFKKTKLYLFNPSGSPVNCMVVSFYAEFDPLVLALGQIEISIPDEITSTSVITSFNAPLPTGNNVIGKVEVTNGSATDVNNIKLNVGDIQAKLVELLKDSAGTNAVNLHDIINQMFTLKYADFYDHVSMISATNYSADTAISNGGFCHLHMLTNDGEGDLTFSVYGEGDTAYRSITIKAGETINDFKFKGSAKVSGSNYSFRAMVSYP